RSVFSRRGIVYCRKEVGGTNIRVDSEEQFNRLLDGRLPQLPNWNKDRNFHQLQRGMEQPHSRGAGMPDHFSL
ncbi:MAG: hypothetical protein AAGD96_29480, partial [Chloroflexota bacterium]